MKNISSFLLPFSIFVAASPFVTTQAMASDLVINDCSGNLIAMRAVDGQAGLSFNVKPSVAVSTVTLESSADDSSNVIQLSKAVVSGVAEFSNVAAGTYKLCTLPQVVGADVVFLDRGRGQQYAGLALGLGTIGSVVALSQSSSSGSSPVANLVAQDSSSSVVTLSSSGASSSTATSDNKPSGSSIVSSSGCKKKGLPGTSAAGADECGANLEPDPLSPYQ